MRSYSSSATSTEMTTITGTASSSMALWRAAARNVGSSSTSS
jgi:hypothetical protein